MARLFHRACTDPIFKIQITTHYVISILFCVTGGSAWCLNACVQNVITE